MDTTNQIYWLGLASLGIWISYVVFSTRDYFFGGLKRSFNFCDFITRHCKNEPWVTYFPGAALKASKIDDTMEPDRIEMFLEETLIDPPTPTTASPSSSNNELSKE